MKNMTQETNNTQKKGRNNNRIIHLSLVTDKLTNGEKISIQHSAELKIRP